ncbi:MAG: hypothetical protein AB7E95_13695, partial [Kiritimatiellales bacterium]
MKVDMKNAGFKCFRVFALCTASWANVAWCITNGVITLDIRGDGEISQRYENLEEAVLAARQFPANLQKAVTLGEGRYFLDKTLSLNENDSNLTICAAPNSSAVIIGGRQITGWQKKDKFWIADMPGTKDRRRDFRMLLVNGRYAPRARYPETGRLQHESIFKPRWLSTEAGGWERKPTESELTTLHYKTCDLGPWLNPDNAEITVYH